MSRHRNPSNCLLFVIGAFATMFTLPVLADWQGRVALSATRFQYEEFDSRGHSLNREEGVIPGVVVGIRRRESNWGIESLLTYHAGDVDYDGQTNVGIPVTTRTDERIVTLAIKISRSIRGGIDDGAAIYGDVGYHSWSRDIQPTRTSAGTPVYGLSEEYEWWTVALGGKAVLSRRENARWLLDARVFRVVNPVISVDFDGLYDKATLSLGEEWGARLSVNWQRRWRPNMVLNIEPFVASWKFGASSWESLKQNGIVVGAVSEPRSDTLLFGVTVGLSYEF